MNGNLDEKMLSEGEGDMLSDEAPDITSEEELVCASDIGKRLHLVRRWRRMRTWVLIKVSVDSVSVSVTESTNSLVN